MPVGVPSTVYLEVWGAQQFIWRCGVEKRQPSGHRTGQTALGIPVSVRMRLEIFVRVSQSWHCEPLGPDDCHIGWG